MFDYQKIEVGTGGILVIKGGMFAGKTEMLILIARRLLQADVNIASFKHINDRERYDPVNIASHDGARLEAIPTDTITKMRDLIPEGTQAIFVDEAQFFGQDIVGFAKEQAALGRLVVIAGLDTDYLGNTFGPMGDLLAIATDIQTMHAVCTICKRPACRSQRIVKKSGTVLVGHKDAYAARCMQHWSPEPE